MCGRYTLKAEGQTVADFFGLLEEPDLEPRYNIAPTQQIPVVLEDALSQGRAIEMMHWGLIPSWAKDPSIGSRMINARAETVSEKPSYRSAFKRRRCLIVADGFYEWKKTDDGKQPYYLRLGSGDPFGFAGLWESWSMDGGEEVRSATIITTEPNEVVAEIHNRMPVILPPDLYDVWLEPDNDDREELLSMLVSASPPAEEMEAYPVSKRVNRPANDEPGVLEPV
ncbi:MAG: SOS response-associated peptidase [Rubrobacteraceae bacterium]